MDLYAEAIQRFKKLFAQAKEAGLHEPAAVTLATADAQGRPSARTVLLKEVNDRGFVFYTNLQSRKGGQLASNPRAALCFFWDPFMEQVLVEGVAEPVSASEADAYWATRPRENQLASFASLQSQPLDKKETLKARFEQCKLQFAGREVPRPPHWSGWRIIPDRIEFWKTGPFRLNERLLYQKTGGRWTAELLYP